MIDKLGLDGLGGASVRVEPAVVGLEPVHWYLENEDEYMSEKLRKEHERLNSYTFKLCKVAHPLYSAATVERLVQERGDCLALVQSLYEVLGQKKEQLAAMTQERNALKEKQDNFCMQYRMDCDEESKELEIKLLASQAYSQQLREALEICKKEMQGDKWDALYIDGVLASK